MSTAHRPTWEPAKARPDSAHISQQVQRHYIASHTKLKFRQPETKRDLKLELAQAERAAENKKRAAKGLPPLEDEAPAQEEQDEESRKRRKVIEEARALDRDDESDDEEAPQAQPKAIEGEDDDDDSEDDDEDEDEDETALLLAELEKIKRERAADKARQEALEQSAREDEIALGNPLLNLEQSFQKKDFGVKRRWDDDVIFKNQAVGNSDRKEGGFVNDLTRSDFHRKFINRYIK